MNPIGRAIQRSMVPEEYREHHGDEEEFPEEKPNSRLKFAAGILAIGVVLGFALGFLFTSVAGSPSDGGAPLFDEGQVSRIFDEAGPAVVEIDVGRTVRNVTIPGCILGPAFWLMTRGTF